MPLLSHLTMLSPFLPPRCASSHVATFTFIFYSLHIIVACANFNASFEKKIVDSMCFLIELSVLMLSFLFNFAFCVKLNAKGLAKE